MEQYKKEITELYERMTKDDQIELHNKITRGDVGARDRVIQNCLPLVVRIAENYHKNNKHVDLDDLIQEGNMALIKAVDKWDVNRGNITTVATFYIRNTFNDMINDSRYKVVTPYTLSRTAAEDLRKIKNVDSNDAYEIAMRLKMKPKRVKRLLNSKASRVDFDYVKDICGEEKEEPRKCISDVYELCENNLEGIDKQVFGMYIGMHGHRMKIKKICTNLNMTEQDVRSIINRCKTTLKRVANA